MPVCRKCGKTICVPEVSQGDKRTPWECCTCFGKNLNYCQPPSKEMYRKGAVITPPVEVPYEVTTIRTSGRAKTRSGVSR